MVVREASRKILARPAGLRSQKTPILNSRSRPIRIQSGEFDRQATELINIINRLEVDLGQFKRSSESQSERCLVRKN